MKKGCIVTAGVLAVVVLGGLALLLLLSAMQERLAFHPSRIIEFTPEDLGLEHADCRIRTADGLRLAGWWVPGPPDAPAVLFLHGNAGNIGHRLEQIRGLHEAGLSVLIVDYRGYGQSTGRPTEGGLYRDAAAAWEYLTRSLGIPARRAIVYGESIGSAPALHLCGNSGPAGTPAGVVVEGAFTSAPDMAHRALPFLPVRWILRLRMDNLSAVRSLRLPILFIHGTRDEIVPVRMGRALYEASVSPRKEMLEIPGAMHNTVWMTARQEVAGKVGAFARAACGPP
ncbi:MAG TPA: alpha/beta hydrolase [Candidatus Saccharimonadales bacterium]|nr:alpha/beta hydrolase [Candidatus Saccharimonadales bacterium]